MNFPASLAKLNWYPIMFQTQTSKRSSCEQKKLTLSELSRRDAEKPRTLKEMSQGGQSQLLEWAMVHTLAWKHDIAEGGKTPFYHSVRFAPSLPVKHAICPRHRSSCWLIECDRAIHTLLPIRQYLLQEKKGKKIATRAQWRAVRQRAPTSWPVTLPIWEGRPGVMLEDATRESAASNRYCILTLFFYSVFNKTELYMWLKKLLLFAALEGIDHNMQTINLENRNGLCDTVVGFILSGPNLHCAILNVSLWAKKEQTWGSSRIHAPTTIQHIFAFSDFRVLQHILLYMCWWHTTLHFFAAQITVLYSLWGDP